MNDSPYAKLDNWANDGHTFLYQDHLIFFRDDGEGEPLVLIHGYPTSSWDWFRVWPELISRYRCIAADMIGFGFSDKPRPYEYSIADQATLHEALLDKLGVTSFHILAHDYGDSVAQELLARYESQKKESRKFAIKSICFLNGGLFIESARPRPIQKILKSPIGAVAQHLITESTFNRSFSRIFAPDKQPSPDELATFWTLIQRANGTAVNHAIIQYLRERVVRRDRWVDAMAKTEVPLRLIDGLLDPVSGKTIADRYRELIPNADVVDLPGVGHYPQVEDPEAVLEAYRVFRERAMT